MGGALQPQPLHARAQFRVQQQVLERAHHLVGAVRIEENRGAVDHLRQGASVRTGHRAAARHGFQRGQSEPFVERREHEKVTGVIKLEQVGIGYKTQHADAIADARFARRGLHLIRKPGGLPGQHQVVAKLRAGADQFGERPDEADLILARLQIAHRKKEWPIERKALADGGPRRLERHRAEFRAGGVGSHHHFVLVQVAVNPQDGAPRKLAHREHPRRAVHRPPHRPAQLPRPPSGEILGMLQKADVVDAHHHRHRARHRSRVLHVKQIRPVPPQLHAQLVSQAQERVGGDGTGTNAGGQTTASLFGRHIGQDLAFAVLGGGESVQKASDVDLIACEVTADGVCINGNPH